MSLSPRNDWLVCGVLRGLVAAWLIATLLGCSSGASQRAVVRVLDEATGAPVTGASVEILATEFFLPVDPFPTIDPADHQPARAKTDSEGLASLRLPADLPARLTIEAAGYQRLEGVIEPRGRSQGEGSTARWWLSGVTHAPPVGAAAPLPRFHVEILPP